MDTSAGKHLTWDTAGGQWLLEGEPAVGERVETWQLGYGWVRGGFMPDGSTLRFVPKEGACAIVPLHEARFRRVVGP